MDCFDPNDPYGYMPEMPEMQNLTPEKQQEIRRRALFGCLAYTAALVIAIAISALLGSCTTPRQIERHHHHHYEADTLALQAQVDRHLQSWHQQMEQSLFAAIASQLSQQQQTEQQHEVTTETITTVTDSLGRQLRTEQRTISRDISREQRQLEQRITREYEARLRVVVDSVDDIWQQRITRLQAHWQQTDSTALTKTPAGDNRPWYRRWWDSILLVLIGSVIAFCAGYRSVTSRPR